MAGGRSGTPHRFQRGQRPRLTALSGSGRRAGGKADQTALDALAAEVAKKATTAALEALSKKLASMPCLVTGTYTGDGAESRLISLGFQPKALLVMREEGYSARPYTDDYYGGLALPGKPVCLQTSYGTRYIFDHRIHGASGSTITIAGTPSAIRRGGQLLLFGLEIKSEGLSHRGGAALIDFKRSVKTVRNYAPLTSLDSTPFATTLQTLPVSSRELSRHRSQWWHPSSGSPSWAQRRRTCRPRAAAAPR